MADPLLTALCAICHIGAPKYKCPRCGMQTCSLPCIKKHKAWSECSGERDATAYVAKSQLRTAAGIDHDYNFLHGMERSMERAERVVVRDRGLIAEEELHPLTVQEVRWRTGKDGKRRKILVTRALREAKGRSFERFLGQRLRKLNVTVMCVPSGMARMRENLTTLNRRSGRINWQVEWLAFEAGSDETGPRTKRVLGKTMDDVPLHQAYRTALDDQTKTENKQSKKGLRGGRDEYQLSWDSKYPHTGESLQDPHTGTWFTHRGPVIEKWPSEQDDEQRDEYQFFLARPYTRSDQPMVVTSLSAGDCLRVVLKDTRVLEFPTIYVLRGGKTLPAGFVLGRKDASPAGPQQGTKRKGGAVQDKKTGRAAKKRRGGKELEEGEVGSGEEGELKLEDDDGEKGAVGLEAGEVIAEQSFGEEDGEEEDEDDETSSSGSDSE